MPDVSPRTPWTHRQYFKQFRLNVEQYAEILIAQAFGGIKEGDAQPCYDVEAPGQTVKKRLLDAGIPRGAVESCFCSVKDGPVRIEVKAKLARTRTGRAHVIHCRDHKLDGVRDHPPATHFAVVLFDGEGEGIAEHAWFFPSEAARQLRRANTRSRYIAVTSLNRVTEVEGWPILDIKSVVNDEATKAIFPDNKKAAQQES
jgi:hypothetical protein